MTIPGSTNPLLLKSAAAAGGYQVERSLRFNSSDSGYLSRVFSTPGNRRTWTWSGWLKRTRFAVEDFIIGGGNGASFLFSDEAGGNKIRVNGTNLNFVTAQFFRDCSSWYHLLLQIDTTQAASSDRAVLYVNGSRVTALDATRPISYPSLNEELGVSTGYTSTIGGTVSAGRYLDGYLADIHFIDGQALTPSSFGEFDTNNVWQPIAYTGTYGTNGFRLPFSDNSGTTATTLGKDAAGSNNWTPNNFSVTAGAGNDSLVDSPTNYGTDTGAGGEVRGNYCAGNPLARSTYGTTLSFANGNLDWTFSGNAFSSIYPGTGKWYAEAAFSTFAGGGRGVGIGDAAWGLVTGYLSNGTKYLDSSNSAYGASYVVGDVVGIAWDLDAKQVTFYKNGISQGTLTYTSTKEMTFAAFRDGAEGTNVCTWNFGQRPFAYTAPSGFKALCTANLPEPTIADGSTVMDVKLYTGNGSTQTISGLNFSPDLVWIKGRSGATDHALYDTVRGVQKQLESNTTTDETTESTGLTAFNSDGFALGALAQANTSSATYAAWCWNESVSAGFDIVTYTGNGSARTIAHSLGVAPNLIIVKARTTASTDQGWPVYHSANTAAPETDYLLLNSTAATADLNTVWNDTAPTSSVFSVGTNALVNANADTYVAYCFAPVAGYSSFGSYTGNGSADGPFVYLGFRPAVVIVKMSSSTGNWTILDDKREGYNVDNDPLFPNLSNAEGTTDLIDITSNGFKVRTTDATFNTNAGTYIYAAWASSPFAYSRAR